MLVVVEFIEAIPAHRGALRPALLMLARAFTEKKLGCHQFDVAQDDLDGSSFLVYQVFTSQEAHVAHLEMPEHAEHRLLVDPWIKTRRHLTYELLSGAGLA
jgi:(4S)-4-hydroxy-5-phosphonooxypentane-2,3-dione isomerase